jgi:hypothetical protein
MFRGNKNLSKVLIVMRDISPRNLEYKVPIIDLVDPYRIHI